MLTEAIVAASLLTNPQAAQPVAKPRGPQVAMSAVFLLYLMENKEKKPTEVEVPVAPGTEKLAIVELPARLPSPRVAEVKIPSLPNDAPVAMALPAPIMAPRASSTQLIDRPPPKDFQVAQVTNDEMLKRLERLEQENKQLREQLNKETPGSKQPTVVPSRPTSAINPQTVPAQMVPGWRVSLLPWNATSSTSAEPISVFILENQSINGLLGQHKRPAGDPQMSTTQQMFGYTDEMFVYRLDGWLHVTKPGTYQIGAQASCVEKHPCNLTVKLGGQQIITVTNQIMDSRMLFQGRELDVGDYQMEISFGFSKNSFGKFDPRRMSVHPLIRAPGDQNFRDFGPTELITQADASIPVGPPR
jgi:hypothetical protein